MIEKNIQPIYIVGPTASGKSELAARLARKFDSVVISADSMQIYCGLDIGTAKESKRVREELDYRLVDIVNADSEYSVAEFAQAAKTAIADALQNNKLPIIVGGTGLYFEALLYPMSFANTVKNPQLRQQLQDELEQYGAEYLHDKLTELDLITSQRLHTNDTKRVIRALEIIITTGKTLQENADDNRQTPDAIMVGLNTDRAVLYERINNRVDAMFKDGLVQEVLSVGNFEYQSMQAIGYKEFKNCQYSVDNSGSYVIVPEEISRIKELIKQHTRNYAKRQLTWFRKYSFCKWFECGDYNDAIQYISEQLSNKSQ